MQILVTTVDERSFGQQGANDARVTQARKLLASVKDRKHLLAVLPAGYLRAAADADEDAIAAVARPLVESAKEILAGVVIGVDAAPPSGAPKSVARKGGLPYFIVAWAPGLKVPRVWRQRSVVGAAKAGRQDGTSLESRSLPIDSKKVEVVTCGEGFNPALRDAISERAATLSAIVIPAHRAQGSRHWKAQRFFSEGLQLLAPRAVHAYGSASNSCALPKRSAIKVESDLPCVAGDPWIGLTIYTL